MRPRATPGVTDGEAMSDPMSERNTTNWLLLWIALMVFNKFYPYTARTYGYIALAGLAIWWVYFFVRQRWRDEAERKKERAEIDRNTDGTS